MWAALRSEPRVAKSVAAAVIISGAAIKYDMRINLLLLLVEITRYGFAHANHALLFLPGSSRLIVRIPELLYSAASGTPLLWRMFATDSGIQ